ncbi:hypothetical protein DNL40_15415 [Xylanimonas oleitrophica]|uniref:Permease n=1 Tax=Xylanimonas oleitrophica TaxID=2607479 RepID=A0A2W5WUZ7_9MICO|nr:hypothetical protein [Xylanimonas oleitrophica]PZR51655.1 hypothetical protein DNL40_15415 [Xylanimonas oleitrophica]
MSLSTRAVTTAVLAAAVAAGAYAGTLWLTGVVTVLVVLLALGWAPLLRVPAPGGTTFVVAAAGVAAVGVAWATQGEPVLRHLPIVVAMALVLAFFAEMLRRDGRPRLVESVSGTVAGAVLAVAASGWIATGRSTGGAALVVTAALAVAVAAALSALPVAAGWVGALGAVAVAAVAGAAAGAVVPEVEPLTGLVAGLAGGLGVAALRLLFERLRSLSGPRAGLAAAAVPVTLGGILVFAVGRVLLG